MSRCTGFGAGVSKEGGHFGGVGGEELRCLIKSLYEGMQRTSIDVQALSAQMVVFRHRLQIKSST